MRKKTNTEIHWSKCTRNCIYKIIFGECIAVKIGRQNFLMFTEWKWLIRRKLWNFQYANCQVRAQLIKAESCGVCIVLPSVLLCLQWQKIAIRSVFDNNEIVVVMLFTNWLGVDTWMFSVFSLHYLYMHIKTCVHTIRFPSTKVYVCVLLEKANEQMNWTH